MASGHLGLRGFSGQQQADRDNGGTYTGRLADASPKISQRNFVQVAALARHERGPSEVVDLLRGCDVP